jgi:hypothetical protein
MVIVGTLVEPKLMQRRGKICREPMVQIRFLGITPEGLGPAWRMMPPCYRANPVIQNNQKAGNKKTKIQNKMMA